MGAFLDQVLASTHEMTASTKEFWSLPDARSPRKTCGNTIEVWSLSEALVLSGVYDDVKFFAMDFASTFGSDSTNGIPDNDVRAPTPSEIDRIERAFYRYELFRNIFSKDEEKPSNYANAQEHRELFLDRFQPWENEQLAPVYEYIFDKLSIGRNSSNSLHF